MSQQELLKIKHDKEFHEMKVRQLEELEETLRTASPNASASTKTAGTKPATTAKPATTNAKKALAPKEELESADDDDLDSALGTGEDDDTREEAVEAGAAEISEDDIRKLLTKITTAKGTAGKNKALAVLKKYTKKESGLVKDLIKGKYEQIYKELKKI